MRIHSTNAESPVTSFDAGKIYWTKPSLKKKVGIMQVNTQSDLSTSKTTDKPNNQIPWWIIGVGIATYWLS
jgi:hypothetical protein